MRVFKAFAMLVGAALVCGAATGAERPHVLILGTGGTIAGAGKASSASYGPGEIGIAELVAAVPGLADLAIIDAEQLSNVGSYDITPALWVKLASRIGRAFSEAETAGVIVTHGTDTMEETAYLLSLVLPRDKPVVLVGAMRPATALSPDGPHNMLDAARVAVSSSSRGRGPMLVINDTIFDARYVTKVHNHRLDAFAATGHGPIGDVTSIEPVFFAAPERGTAPAFRVTAYTKLPEVGIVHAYAGLSGEDVRAAAINKRGLVIAGVGAGNFSASARKAVQELTLRGIPVVRAARQGYGDVWPEDENAKERSEAVMGTVAARELTPAKARILLMLSLLQPRSREELQQLFDRHGRSAAAP
jgi:L-asparaginase